MSSKGMKHEEAISYQALLDENCALKDEIQCLEGRLAEADELRRAISEGDLDALVIPGPKGEMVFSLEGADQAYRVLVETMNEGTATFAHDGTILYCNRRFADLLKMPLQLVPGTSIYSFIAPENVVPFKALLDQKIGSSGIDLLTGEGTPLPAYLSVNSLQTEESPNAWCLVVTDLTEQKKSEEILAAERLARSIIEQAAEAIIVCDENGKITRFSNVASKICGKDPTFKPFDEVFDLRFASGEDVDKRISPALASLKGSILLHVEAKYERDDGQRFYLLLNAGHLKNAEGEIIGCVVTLADITQLKLLEEELRKSRDSLETRVWERTAELSRAKEDLEVTNEELTVELEYHIKLEVAVSQAKQELESKNMELLKELDLHRKLEAELAEAKQELEVMNEELQAELEQRHKIEGDLIKARDAAEASANAKASFLANMSHELRTPMNAVIGFSSLLLEEPLAPEQIDYLEHIKSSGEAMLTLINDILDFSRAEKEKIELERQPLSLRTLIEESLEMVLVQANKKGLSLSYTINYGTPDIIIGDHGRLRQILVNLLSNAVKFTDNGQVSVSISSKVIVEKNREILFSVKDTGIGIPQEKMDQLFQPFSQLELSLSRKRDGAGLGLIISKRLVELMGGRIWAESSPGVGSTFSFAVQAKAIPGRHLDLRTLNKTKFENLAETNPLAILVAEDNPSNQKVLVHMLRRMGYRVDAVADGFEVLEALERRLYDLIIMDVKMPEMDGLLATQEIRKRWPENGPKIIAVTAYALEGDKDKCLEAGMDDYIAKPVQKGELIEALRRCSHKGR